MQNIDFHNIRPLRGSANNGFEELCCQLAGCEDFPVGSRFVRNGTPDGGVEAYWIRTDGTEHGWQAKLFFEIESSQWQQLDKSISTALEKHPQLTHYTVCLPIDLPDARNSGEQSLRQKWDARVKKWEGIAATKGMTVTFLLWGHSEILTRLALERHVGRRWFWLKQVELSPKWFSDRLTEATAAAGPRYTPELNVQLPIAERFESLGYTRKFRDKLSEIRLGCRDEYRSIDGYGTKPDDPDGVKSAHNALIETWENLTALLQEFCASLPKISLYGDILKAIDAARSSVIERSNQVAKIAREKKAQKVKVDGEPYAQESEREDYSSRKYRLALEELRDYLEDTNADLAGRPVMLLVGEAGSGKTHLLCDIAEQRMKTDLPTVVLLGQQFDRGNVWNQIILHLGLDCTRDEFLGALDSIGEANESRALIFIDAINEASEIKWQDELPAILAALKNYPHVGLVVSCRTTYEKVLVRDDLMSNGVLSRVEHDGFASNLHVALRAFCSYYRIETLNTPPLDPEFENPLFLKLFCQGLCSRNLTRPPKGHTGLQRIFSYLLDSVNKKLASPDELDYDDTTNIVRQAVDAIADEMLDVGHYQIPRDKARTLLDQILLRPSSGYSKSLLRKLLDEGILADDFFWKEGQDSPEAVVRFGYERMTDFQLAGRLLDKHVVDGNVHAEFADEQPLRKIFAEDRLYRLGGLLTATIVLVPERYSVELIDLIPRSRSWYQIRQSFVESLTWRQATHITPSAIHFVEELLDSGTHTSGSYSPSDVVFDRLIQVLAQPNHPLNACWLHQRLLLLSLPERDLQWSTFLHRTHSRTPVSKPSSIERLLDWAWPDNTEDCDPCAGFEDEVVELASMTLTWCFTTANRFIRDRATKALVSILQHRLPLIPKLLQSFLNVDDLYVLERLYAAVYGAVMRNKDRTLVRTVADHVFRNIFESRKPPAHVLLRDYARGIIEYASHLGCPLDFDLALTRPPYNSEPLPEELPSWDELQKKYEDQRYGDITLSLMPNGGDFARYVLGSDS